MDREDYLEFIQDAKELIAEFGQDCWWQKPGTTVAGVPGYSTASDLPDPIPCKMAFFSQKDLDRGVMQFMDVIAGTEVPDNAQVGLLAGGIDFTPQNPDSVRRGAIDAEPSHIIKLDLLAPNGTPVLYYVTVAA